MVGLWIILLGIYKLTIITMSHYKPIKETHIFNIALPELSIQYKDFAVWQRNYLSGERLQHQLDYWKNKLRDYEELQLPTDRPRPAEINYTGEDALFSINQEKSESSIKGLGERA